RSAKKMSKSPRVEHDPIDPLSDHIDLLRIHARVHGIFELTAPFAIAASDADESDVDLILMAMLRGTLALVPDEGATFVLNAGDLLLRKRSGPYVMRDAPSSRARVQRLARCRSLAQGPLRAGGKGAPTASFVGLGFRLAPQARQTLFSQLPPSLLVPPDAGPSLATAVSLFRNEA